MTAKINGGGLLPEDVMIEILSWLPVKTLLQFKCVCKSWYEIITSSDFISKHLNNYYNNINNGCLLARNCNGHLFEPKSESESESESESKWLGLFPDETFEDLSHQTLDLPLPISRIDGPCNGLYYVESGFGYFNFSGDCGLWNPATKEFKLLPAIPTKSNLSPGLIYFNHVCGFGLDSVTNDYEVVVILQYKDEETLGHFPSSVIVYTLGTDSWRHWGDLAQNYILGNSKCYTYMNGIYFWPACDQKDRRVILSFDMATDKFQQERAIPEELQTSNSIDGPDCSYFSMLALYHDSIAMFSVHEVERYLDIWVMNDGSWVKEFSWIPVMGIRNPVGYWKNGNIFVESDTNELMLADPSTREIKDIIHLGSFCEGVHIHKESLVSIKDKGKTFDRM